MRLLFFILALTAQGLHAGSEYVVSSWGVNAPVRAILPAGNVLYLGGEFDVAGPYTGGGVLLDAVSSSVNAQAARVEGHVYAVVSDGSGGWYLGGDFWQVGGQSRQNLAHLFSNGSLDGAFAANCNGEVDSLALNGSTLYIGGFFTSVNGLSRPFLAALNSTSGNLLPFSPNPDAAVLALALSGTALVAGGNFLNLGGLSRHYIGAVDAAGLATAFDPSADGSVKALVLQGSSLYVGGYFYTIGGQIRRYVAALDAAGAAQAFDAGSPALIGNHVKSLAINGSTLYVGGKFASMGGAARSNIAALNATSGAALIWDPGCDAAVWSLLCSGSTVYAGGAFTRAGGLARKRVAAFDASSNTSLAWDPVAGATVVALAGSGSKVYLGGNFNTVGGLSREHLLALDASTLLPTAFNPGTSGGGTDSFVNALAVSGNTLYVGGGFTQVSGQARSHLAAIDTLTSLPTAWNPAPDATVRSLALDSALVYAGGDFLNAGGQSRHRIAALDMVTGLATAFDPNADNQVTALSLQGALIAGGAFSTIGGASRSNLAALNPPAGAASSFNPSPNSTVLGILAAPNLLYFFGNFFSPRKHLAALSWAGMALAAFDPGNVDGDVNAALYQNKRLYVGGSFYNIGGYYHQNFAVLDAGSGQGLDYYGGINGPVKAMAGDGASRIYLGGDFQWTLGVRQDNFAVMIDNPAKDIAAKGDITAYPSPAWKQVCFALDAPAAGRLVIEVYNAAMQHVATFSNDIAGAGQRSVCEDLGPMVTGAYFYKASLGGTRFATRKFLVIR